MSLLLGSKSQRKSAHKSQGIWNHFFALHRRWPSPSRINAFMLFLRQEGYVFISVSVFCLLISSITERKNYTQPIFSYSAERRYVGHVLEGYAGSIGVIAWHRHTLHGKIYYIWRLFYTNSFATSAGLAKVGALYSGPTYTFLCLSSLLMVGEQSVASRLGDIPPGWRTRGRQTNRATSKQASLFAKNNIIWLY